MDRWSSFDRLVRKFIGRFLYFFWTFGWLHALSITHVAESFLLYACMYIVSQCLLAKDAMCMLSSGSHYSFGTMNRALDTREGIAMGLLPFRRGLIVELRNLELFFNWR